MIFPAAAIASLLVTVIAGGDPRKMGRIRFHYMRLAIVPLLLQQILFGAPGIPTWVLSTIYLLSFVALSAFFWMNRRLHGLTLMLVGTLSNTLVIALNGGRMAASPGAFRTAGIVIKPGQFANSRPVAHATLSFLGDVFAIPAHFPLANVFSAGDVMIAVGIAWCIVKVCGTRWSSASLVWHHRDHQQWKFARSN